MKKGEPIMKQEYVQSFPVHEERGFFLDNFTLRVT